MKVSLDFSAASMRMTKTSCAVMNISMKSPCATDMPGLRTVLTFDRSAPNIAATSPPAHIDASSCAGTRKAVRSQGTWPDKLRPKDTCDS